MAESHTIDGILSSFIYVEDADYGMDLGG